MFYTAYYVIILLISATNIIPVFTCKQFYTNVLSPKGEINVVQGVYTGVNVKYSIIISRGISLLTCVYFWYMHILLTMLTSYSRACL